VGRNWDYSRIFYSTNFEPDTLANSYGDTVFGSSTVEIQSIDTLFDSIPTYRFHTTWIEGSSGSEFDTYRNNTADGLYSYGYKGASSWVGPPKQVATGNVFFEFGGKRYAGIDALYYDLHRISRDFLARHVDSITYEDPPIRELAYPLEIGERWTYRSEALGHPFDMEKEATDFLTITAPAGEFDCFEVAWFWDIDGDDQWDTDILGYDYVSSVGTVMRRFVFIGIRISDYNSIFLGTCDVIDEYELTAYGS
jgi:hypothetical protein